MGYELTAGNMNATGTRQAIEGLANSIVEGVSALATRVIQLEREKCQARKEVQAALTEVSGRLSPPPNIAEILDYAEQKIPSLYGDTTASSGQPPVSEA